MIAPDYKCFSFNELRAVIEHQVDGPEAMVLIAIMAMELDVAIEDEVLLPRTERG